MQTSAAAQYALMSDDELLHVAEEAGGLTAHAAQALHEELARRGLDRDEVAEYRRERLQFEESVSIERREVAAAWKVIRTLVFGAGHLVISIILIPAIVNVLASPIHPFFQVVFRHSPFAVLRAFPLTPVQLMCLVLNGWFIAQRGGGFGKSRIAREVWLIPFSLLGARIALTPNPGRSVLFANTPAGPPDVLKLWLTFACLCAGAYAAGHWLARKSSLNEKLPRN